MKRGFDNGREIVSVVYRPERITPEEMIAALKSANTWLGRKTP